MIEPSTGTEPQRKDVSAASKGFLGVSCARDLSFPLPGSIHTPHTIEWSPQQMSSRGPQSTSMADRGGSPRIFTSHGERSSVAGHSARAQNIIGVQGMAELNGGGSGGQREWLGPASWC